MNRKHGVIYKLTNGKDNYIGSSFNLETRKKYHKDMNYLKSIVEHKNCRYDIIEEGEFTKRELLDKEREHIINNLCINKYKPLTQFKNAQHKNMLNWGKQYVYCDICNCDITRWNVSKHEKSIKHQMNCKKNNCDVNILIGDEMTYMKAVKLYNQEQKNINDNHTFIIPKKNTDEYLDVMKYYADHI